MNPGAGFCPAQGTGPRIVAAGRGRDLAHRSPGFRSTRWGKPASRGNPLVFSAKVGQVG